MPLDSARRHQIEQDAITAAWEAERLAACDDAIALLHEIADLERDKDGDVILGADAVGHTDLLSRITVLIEREAGVSPHRIPASSPDLRSGIRPPLAGQADIG